MSRKFITEKEIALINRVNKELIQSVIGQEVTYFAILADRTRANDLYNEAIKKVWATPVRVNALVYYENTTEQVGTLPPDAKFNIDVYFHNLELQERNLVPKMGDFVQFGEAMYEIMSTSQPQMVYGQIENKVMTKCPCTPARKDQFTGAKQPMPITSKDPNAPNY